jgi:glycosyltransferase involved in cell wall biosynthesis
MIFKYANHIIFISKNVKKYFSLKIKNSKNKTSIIYYGIDRFYFNYGSIINKKLKNLRDNKKQFIVLNIARHIPQKRIDLLLLGFNEFLKENSNTKLILVGSGPDTKKLKLLSAKLRIIKKIIWIDYAENIKELFNISDVFCLTSEYEGLGLVLLESLYLKKPIITVKKSAMNEIIKDSYNGISLKNNFTSKDLSNCLTKLKKNKIFRNKIVKNGKTELKHKFSVEKMYNQTQQIYINS